ncbi:NAD(P)/FAD-dependent oxidoreductase [Candidatus Daviesbacteria bacterium]|nr:NAD(P)/FAD-dependent oxidoreductase [Candidatus Daviesbacteria bacterium]
MKHIVILGGGFGGIKVALDLPAKKCGFKITLVNDSPYHSFHPDLYELATTEVLHNDKLTFKNLMGTVNIPLNQIFKHKKVEIFVDQVKGINLNKKEVILGQSNLKFDYLVIALGSTTNYLGIEGAKEYSHPFKNTEDALNTRNDLCEIKNGSHVVIAGGGFTGVELAGLLAKFLKERGKLTLIEASSHLFNNMPKWAGSLAESRLTKLGVKLNLGCQITRVDRENIYCISGEKISCDYLIWTAGVKGAVPTDGIKGAVINGRGQIRVKSDLSAEGHDGVWVVGDMADLKDKNGSPIPQTARAALAQGKAVAKNIINKSMNLPPENYRTPNSYGFVVPIGPHYALSNIFNLNIYGLLAWFIKMCISLKYMLSILTPAVALQTWWRGVKIRINE